MHDSLQAAESDWAWRQPSPPRALRQHVLAHAELTAVHEPDGRQLRGGNPAFGLPSELLLTADAGWTWYPVTF
jgi:hypothetical protein